MRRNFDVSNISFLVAGTLVILITSLFVNVGSQTLAFSIGNGQTQPNKIVMNSIISSASSGLLIALTNQYTNVVWDDAKRQQVENDQILYQYDIQRVCNGVIAGLVSVSASSQNINLFGAAMIGVIGSIIYT